MLDAALANETLAPWFPILQSSVPITAKGAARLKKSVGLGKALAHTFRCLAWGRSSDALSGPDLKELLLAIAEMPQGYNVATEILSMRFFSDDDNKVDHPQELVDAGRELLSRAKFDNRDNMHNHRLRMIVNACLIGKDGEETARTLCSRFKAGLANYTVYAFNFNQLIEGLFKTQPRVALDFFFGEGLDEHGEEIIDIDSFDDPSDQRKNPLDALEEEQLLNWCADGGQTRYVAIAQAISFVRVENESPPAWTSIALKLLDTAPDPLVVLELFIDRFSPRSWSGSRAAIMESRTRLLDDLKNHSNASISTMAKQKRPELDAMIARERDRETKYDRDRDERFE